MKELITNVCLPVQEIFLSLKLVDNLLVQADELSVHVTIIYNKLYCYKSWDSLKFRA